MSISIINVARAMGIDMSNEQAWSAGAQAREEYKRIYGAPPPKELTVKTCGVGSHFIAQYPESMFYALADIVRRVTSHGGQIDLFRAPELKDE